MACSLRIGLKGAGFQQTHRSH